MKRILAWMLAVLLVLTLGACGQEGQEETPARTVEETAEEFLTEFFTADRNQRYQTFQTQSQEDLQKAAEDYYSGLAEFTSEECLSQMISNRDLARYDSLYDGVAVSVEEISIGEFDQEGNTSFTVKILADGTAAEYQGQLTVTESEGGALVERFWCPI